MKVASCWAGRAAPSTPEAVAPPVAATAGSAATATADRPGPTTVTSSRWKNPGSLRKPNWMAVTPPVAVTVNE